MASLNKSMKCPKGFLPCPSPKNKLMVIDPNNGHIYCKSGFLNNYWECGVRVFVKLDHDLNLSLMDHSVRCSAGLDDIHHHDPPARQLVSLLLLRWQSFAHATREKMAVDDAIWIVYEEWREPLPITKQSAIKFFSKSISLTPANRKKWCVPRDLVATLKFYKKTVVWPRVDHFPGNEVDESETSSSEDSDIEIEEESPHTRTSRSQENYIDDCNVAASPRISERIVNVSVDSDDTVFNEDCRFILIVSWQVQNLLQIDPESGHVYERLPGVYGRCARRIFLKMDNDLGLRLMDHSVECAATETGPKRHNHPPPPRPLVNFLLFRWQSVLHGQSNPISIQLDIDESVGAVYDEWTEDLPLGKERAIRYTKTVVDDFQKCLKSHVNDPRLSEWLNWLKICGTKTLAVALAFFASNRMWPKRENQESMSRGDRTSLSDDTIHPSSSVLFNRRGIPTRATAIVAQRRNARFFSNTVR